MKDAEKKALDLDRKKLSMKNMYFNRFLLIRYLTAGFFFTNLYWFAALLMAGSKLFLVAIALVVAMLPMLGEQARLFSNPKNIVPWTIKYYWLQLGVNVVLIPLLFTPLFRHLFPFMNQGSAGKAFVLAFVLVGIMLSLLIQDRLRKISSNHDKHYSRIQQYKKTLHL